MFEVDELLRWIGDPRREAPVALAVEPVAVCSRIAEHRLCGRYLEQCALTNAPPGGEHLYALVEREQRCVLGTIARQVDALREFAEQEGAPELVVLKGMATYQVTGDVWLARTGDVDVVVDESADVDPILAELGYERTRAPFLHEIGEFTRLDIELDVHSHFSIYSCPADDVRGEVRSPVQGGSRVRRHLSPHRRATFGHFLATSRQGCGSAAGLRFSGPELLAVVLAGHSFMNYTNAWSISHREKVYVRLGELLDIERLLAAPDFDCARFDSLADELEAEHALAWVNAAAMTLIGRTLVPGVRSPSTLPPRCLWWDLWLDVPPEPRLLLTDDWYDIEPIATALGAVPLVAGAWIALEPCGAGSLATSTLAPRFEVRIDVAVQVRRLTVRVAPATCDGSIRVRVDRGSWATECIGTAGVGLVSVTGAQADITWTSGPGGEEISVCYSGARGGSAMLVGVGRGRNGGIDEATIVALREL